MGVRVEVAGGDAVVTMTGWDVLWAFARTVRVPLAGITDAVVEDRRTAARPFVVRWFGTYVPGLVTAGRFAWFGRSAFWCVHRARRVLVIRCAPGLRYDKVVLEVPDPDGDAAMLRGAAPHTSLSAAAPGRRAG